MEHTQVESPGVDGRGIMQMSALKAIRQLSLVSAFGMLFLQSYMHQQKACLKEDSAYLQPFSGKQAGGDSSQRPPSGLLVGFRGSMRPVPFRSGMRSIKHAGTRPHSPGLFCTHIMFCEWHLQRTMQGTGHGTSTQCAPRVACANNAFVH